MTQQLLVDPPIKEAAEAVLSFPGDMKLIRSKLGINQSELGRKLGVHKVLICCWEKGKYAPKDPLILFMVNKWAEQLRNSPPQSS